MTGTAASSSDENFFLKDNVLEDSLQLLSDNYGVLEKNKSEKINDDGYAVQIRHISGGWRFSIDISSLNVAPDETQFPNADEMNLLSLDLFARMGIDISAPFTETVLWEDGDMKVVLEDTVLKNAMDFNGLTSLTFSGSYHIESNDRHYTLEDVTIEFGK